MSQPKTFATEGIVLKRMSVGETDRVITFLTRDFGKLVGIAKGVRSLKSSRRAHLEPGSYIKIFGVYTKSLPLITQATPLTAGAANVASLSSVRQLSQILEVFDRLFVEGDTDPSAYLTALELHRGLLQQISFQKVQALLGKLLEQLGYQDYKTTAHTSVLDYVAEITDKEMKSFDYLQVK